MNRSFSLSRLAAPALAWLLLAGTVAMVPARAGGNTHVSFGVSVGVPVGGHEFWHGHDRYYAYRGHYYRWDRGRYWAAPPPRGYFVRTLPRNYVRVVYGPDIYYRADHVYYRPSRGGYVI